MNSPSHGIYWGNGAGGNYGDAIGHAGNWESYGYMHNLQTHDNFWDAITFDNVQKVRASGLKSENDGLSSENMGVGVDIINMAIMIWI